MTRLASKSALKELEKSKTKTISADIKREVREIILRPTLSALAGRISARPAHPAKKTLPTAPIQTSSVHIKSYCWTQL